MNSVKEQTVPARAEGASESAVEFTVGASTADVCMSGALERFPHMASGMAKMLVSSSRCTGFKLNLKSDAAAGCGHREKEEVSFT